MLTILLAMIIYVHALYGQDVKNQSPSQQLIVFLPLEKLRVTSGFGPRVHPITGKQDFHQGVDLSARASAVFSIMDGLITKTGSTAILGNFVRISHGEFESVYVHLSMVLAKEGETIVAGSIIGISGNTGRSIGEHLHFGVSYRGRMIDPLDFLWRISAPQTTR